MSPASRMRPRQFLLLNHKVSNKSIQHKNIHIWGNNSNRSCSLLLDHCEVASPEDSRLQIMEQLELHHLLLPLLLPWTSCSLKVLEPTPHLCSRCSAPLRSCIGCCIVPAASFPPLLRQTAGRGRPEGTEEADWGPPTSPCRRETSSSEVSIPSNQPSSFWRHWSCTAPRTSGQFRAGPHCDTHFTVGLWEQTGRSQIWGLCSRSVFRLKWPVNDYW